MWLAKFFKNPANYQKSGRKFTDKTLNHAATAFSFSCCMLANVLRENYWAKKSPKFSWFYHL